jgi:hypothetical protein
MGCDGNLGACPSQAFASPLPLLPHLVAGHPIRLPFG